MYNEYKNYNNAPNNAVYTNYHNTCQVTYANVNNCEVSYSDHGSWHSDHGSYYNYSNCETVYNNDGHSKCTTYTNYANAINYNNPNSGLPTTLSWTTPWSAAGNNTLNTTYIQESVSGIQQLRDKIKWLADNKGQNTVDETAIDALTNTTFNDGNSATTEAAKDDEYDKLRDTLTNLWSNLSAGDPALTARDAGATILRADIQKLKQKADELAAATTTGYSNHGNSTCTTGYHANYTNVIYAYNDHVVNWTDSATTPQGPIPTPYLD